jgi:Uma2 family endonuclease
MRLPRTPIRYTEDQYLSIEREAEERHEYLDGQIYAMAGESPEHGAICANLTGEIRAQLKGTRCQAFSTDMRVRSGPLPRRRYSQKGLYSYPDLLVVCGEMQFLDENRDVIINPKVIIEVASPSTEAFDRGEKFQRYRTHSVSHGLPDCRAKQPIHRTFRAAGEWAMGDRRFGCRVVRKRSHRFNQLYIAACGGLRPG